MVGSFTRFIDNPQKKLLGFLRALLFYVDEIYFTSINSTSKIKTALGGITPPAPLAP